MTIWKIISRTVIYTLIWLGCYHIVNVCIRDDGWLDYIFATLWTGNVFLFDDFTKWFIDDETNN